MLPKILHIGIFNHFEPQWSLRRALQNISSEYYEFDWQSIKGDVGRTILEYAEKADVIFLQIQTAGVVSPQILKYVNDKVKVFNFTGDVRQPVPQWYIDLAPYCTTLFTNNTDAEYLKGLGYDAEYFQIGYNSDFYKSDGDKDLEYPEIVFIGNHYAGTFPLSQYRYDMVTFLQKEYGKNFAVYGKGYPGAVDLNYKQMEEAKIYRSAKIGINCSHFNLKQYSSDRMFRIMACGCFCLTHRFDDLEKEFEDGIHLQSWNDFHELKTMIDLYLKFEDTRHRIANTGHQLVTTKYTWDYRIGTQLMELLKK